MRWKRWVVVWAGLAVAAAMLVGCAPGATTPASGDAASRLEAGKQAIDARNYDLAITELKAAIELDPKLADAHFRLGNVYADQGRSADAEEAYKKALALKPADADILSNLGVVYYQMGRQEEAVQQFQAALKLKPDDAEIHYNLGGVYVQQGRWSDALAEFETAKARKPDLAEVYLGLGYVYKETGRTQEAIAALEKFQELSTSPEWRSQAESLLTELRGTAP